MNIALRNSMLTSSRWAGLRDGIIITIMADAGETISVTGTANVLSGTKYSFHWGDGKNTNKNITATRPSPASHTYTENGVYDVVLEGQITTLNGVNTATANRSANYLNARILSVKFIGSQLRTIGINAFCEQPLITEINLSNTSITAIGDGAFIRCSGIKSISLPETLTSIRGRAFEGCTNLVQDIILPPNTALANNYSPFANTGITGLEFQEPNVMTKIPGNNYFQNLKKLKFIKLPEAVTSIPNNTFTGCSSLTEVIGIEHITSFGTHSFHTCSSLEHLEISPEVTSFPSYCFYMCSKLKTGFENLNKPITLGTNSIRNTSIVSFGSTIPGVFDLHGGTVAGDCFDYNKNVKNILNVGNTSIPNQIAYGCGTVNISLTQLTPPTTSKSTSFEITNVYVPDEAFDDYVNDTVNAWHWLYTQNRLFKVSELVLA